MNVNVIAVGKIKEKFYKDALTEYTKRLSRYCKLTLYEVADEKTPDQASEREVELILEKEKERILKLVREEDYVISLEIKGKKMDSVKLAGEIESLGIRGKSNLTFVIGGSLGLHKSISDRSNLALSFSDLTFPHQLMRVILLEQIYRCYRIINQEPYHK